MKIVEVNRKDSWSAHLNDFDHSLFTLSEFLDSLCCNGSNPVYLDFEMNGKIVAKLAGIKSKGKFKFQNRLSFYSGPAIHMQEDKNLIEKCYQQLIRYARKNNFYRIIKLSYDYPYLPARIKHFKFSKRAEYIIDLTKEKEVIEDNFAHNVICIKRKANNQGYIYRESYSEEMIESLIKMLDDTRKVRMSKGSPYYDYYYIPLFNKSSLKALVKNNIIQFCMVEKEMQSYAIMAVMLKNKRAYALFMGCTPEGYKAGAPTFLNYRLIHSLKEKQFESLNLGGVPLGKSHKGLEEFKFRLGAEKFLSYHGSTNFIKFPFSLLNPFLTLCRLIPENKLLTKIKCTLHIRNFE